MSTNFSAVCIRCPDINAGMMCSKKGAKADFTDGKCLANNPGGLENAQSLWWAFNNDPNSDPSSSLPDLESCKALLDQVAGLNAKAAKKASKKKSDFQAIEIMEKEKAGAKSHIGVSKIPITKQLLEHAFQQVFVVNAAKPIQKPASGPATGTKAKDKAKAEATGNLETLPSAVFPPDISSLNISSPAQSTPHDPSSSNDTATPNSTQAPTDFAQQIEQALAAPSVDDAEKSPVKVTTIVQTSKAPVQSFTGQQLAKEDIRTPSWSVAQPSAYETPSNRQLYPRAIHNACATRKVVDNVIKDANASRTGTVGQPTEVITNYVEISQLPKTVYEYSINYGHIVKDNAVHPLSNPDSAKADGISQRSMKKLIFDVLPKLNPFAGNTDWATDYTTVWSLSPFKQTPDLPRREPVVGQKLILENVAFSKTSGKPCTVSDITLTFTRKLDFYSGTSLKPERLLSDLGDEGTSSVHLAALNGLISSQVSLRNNVISAGANRFYAKDDHKAFLGVQAHRGYFSSVRPGTERILLNIGTMTGTFYASQRVSDFMDVIYANESGAFNEYGRPWQNACQKLLTGREVRILYERARTNTSFNPNDHGQRNRVVAGLGKIPSEQMITHDGKPMSVSKYFTTILHAYPAPSDYYPCVNVGAKLTTDKKTDGKQVYIPAEYLGINPDQFFGRRLAEPHMARLSDVALLHPAATQDKIISRGFPLLGISGSNHTFTSLGIKVQPNLLRIPARFLASPTIAYKDSRTKQDKLEVSHGASWNLRGVHFYRPTTAESYVYTIDLRRTITGGDQRGLSGHMVRSMQTCGMMVPRPNAQTETYWSLSSPSNEAPHKTASDTRSKLHQRLEQVWNSAGKPKLHIVILENTDSDVYAEVKRIYDQYLGVHTVCITSAKLGRRNQAHDMSAPAQLQLLANLSLKYNLKASTTGINHQIVDSRKQSVFASIAKDTMVVGADVSHAPSQMAHCPSVAAVVASQDGTFAQFPGSMRLQASKQEFLDDLYGMMVERLLRYGSFNGTLPKRIIFYRDGVGEDMYERVRKEEIAQVKNAFKLIQANANQLKKESRLPAKFQTHNEELKLTFIVVGKRHKTRFFCHSADQSLDLGFKQERSVEPWQKTTAQPSMRQGKQGFTGVINGSVKPGLIVDRVITRPAINDTTDFFLQSHQALKGTARAAHYIILEKGGMKIDDIQQYTHFFCYNFARATKGVSYAGPAYYADRLADRGTHYLKGYTTGKSGPEIAMNPLEETTVPKCDGLFAYDKRVAKEIQNSKLWNPNVGKVDLKSMNTRVNPWHSNLDDVMFWI